MYDEKKEGFTPEEQFLLDGSVAEEIEAGHLTVITPDDTTTGKSNEKIKRIAKNSGYFND